MDDAEFVKQAFDRMFAILSAASDLVVYTGENTWQEDGYGNCDCIFCEREEPYHAPDCKWMALVKAVSGTASQGGAQE